MNILLYSKSRQTDLSNDIWLEMIYFYNIIVFSAQNFHGELKLCWNEKNISSHPSFYSPVSIEKHYFLKTNQYITDKKRF